MSEKKLHIAFCTDGIFPHEVGGIQRHSRLLIEAIANLGLVKISVIHPHIEKVVFNHPDIHEYDINLEFTSKLYAVNCANYSTSVYKLLQQINPDIVYSQGLAVYTGISTIGYKTIVNPHGLEPYQGITLRDKFTTWPLRIYQDKVFRHAAKIVSLGGRLTEILEAKVGKDKSKIVVLPNAVTLLPEQTKDFDAGKISFLFVARFAHNKGIDILLRSITKINAIGLGDKCEFNLVGKGPLFNDMVKRYPLKNVIFHGFADDDLLEKLYTNCQVFILPTLFEGMPTAVLEAMVHSMPVIVTEVGATSELVDSSNGLLIEKNNETQLVEAIKKIICTDTAELQKMAANSYKKVKNRFTWDIVAWEHLQVFATVAQNNRKKSGKDD